MTSVYTITIKNRSGTDTTYSLSTTPPEIASSGGKVDIWPSVFGTAKSANNTNALFSIAEKYYAVFGSSHAQGDGAFKVSVQGTRAITLGHRAEDGSEVKGTTLHYVVKNGIPQYDDGDHPNNGIEGAFNITTGDFSEQLAKKEHFFIGIAGSSEGIGANAGPSSVLRPTPNSNYQIVPSTKYYVTWGSHETGQSIDITFTSKACVIDLVELEKEGSLDVVILHDKDGNLVIQKESE